MGKIYALRGVNVRYVEFISSVNYQTYILYSKVYSYSIPLNPKHVQ